MYISFSQIYSCDLFIYLSFLYDCTLLYYSTVLESLFMIRWISHMLIFEWDVPKGIRVTANYLTALFFPLKRVNIILLPSCALVDLCNIWSSFCMLKSLDDLMKLPLSLINTAGWLCFQVFFLRSISLCLSSSLIFWELIFLLYYCAPYLGDSSMTIIWNLTNFVLWESLTLLVMLGPFSSFW